MAELFLVRHGQAASSSPAGDAGRELTPQGHTCAKTVGEALKRIDVDADRLLHSPYVRTRQTAQYIGEALGAPLTERGDIVPHGDVEGVAEELLQLRGTTVLVSHLPFLPALVGVLVRAPLQVNIRPATVVHLSLVGRGPAFVSGLYDAGALQALLG